MEKRLTLAAAALALAVIGLFPVLMIVASTFYVAGEFSLTAYQALLASSKQLALLMGRRSRQAHRAGVDPGKERGPCHRTRLGWLAYLNADFAIGGLAPGDMGDFGREEIAASLARRSPSLAVRPAASS